MDETVADLVGCVNSTNGHPSHLGDAPWDLTQAVLFQPLESDRARLLGGFDLVHGRMLGWHGTWSAYLERRDDAWIAYDSRAEDDKLLMFAASFVPLAVVEAFKECGVVWGGHWSGEPPFVVIATGEPYVTPKQSFDLREGVGLLPPTRSNESDKRD